MPTNTPCKNRAGKTAFIMSSKAVRNMKLRLPDDFFGPLLEFIRNPDITDITWNGSCLWLDDLRRGRYSSEVKLSDEFINLFTIRLANLVNRNFNSSEPILEAETDDLRISVIDSSLTNGGKSIAIRKTPAVRRLNERSMIDEGYASLQVLALLKAFVLGHCSIIVTGDVGSGKTELIKYLTHFIPCHERTISIEDNYELRLGAINPKLDCVEIKVHEGFDYSMAIKAALRQLCKWLLMSEARSREVTQLLEAASTGCSVMTTIHSGDVRKIPDRVINMMGSEGDERKSDVYNFFDVAILVKIEKTESGIHRRLSQIGILDRNLKGDNSMTVIYDEGFTGERLPWNLWCKIKESGVPVKYFSNLRPEDDI